jgi:hypothetical protein
MAITLQNYRDQFSEHAAVSDDDVSFAVGCANDDVGDEFLGTKADRARLWYAAHLVQSDYVSRSGDAAPSGPVSSMSAGGFSVSFAVATPATPSKDDFQSTKYGQRYVYLVTRNCGPVDLG